MNIRLSPPRSGEGACGAEGTGRSGWGRFLPMLLLLVVPAAVNSDLRAASAELKSTARLDRDGHGPGRDLVRVDWRTSRGIDAGLVEIPVTGLGRIGPVSVKLHAFQSVPNAYEWDTREWQWWKDCPFDPGKMRPREDSETTGGFDTEREFLRVWSRYRCDGVDTLQEWFFHDLDEAGRGVYDCLITVTNHRTETLEEYGQFFACYTAWNGRNGHLYVDRNGALVNYQDRGSRHLDYYVTGAGSLFDRRGFVPHCPRGGGKVQDRWKFPASISLPSGDGFRHIVMTEEARTAAIAQGMEGIAQDYLIYPPEARLKPQQTFRVHVRHLLVNVPDDELPSRVEACWNAFNDDRARVRSLSKQRAASPEAGDNAATDVSRDADSGR